MMSPYAPAWLLFAYSGKSTAVGQGGSPCPSVGGALTGCTACTNARGTLTGCTVCMKRQRSGSTAGTQPRTLTKWETVGNPTWDLPRGKGMGASWGRNKGLKINAEVFL